MLTLVFILTTSFIYFLVRDTFHPAFMLLFFWTLALITVGILPNFYSLSLETGFFIYCFLLLFAFSSLTTGFIFKSNSSSKNMLHRSVKTKRLFFLSNILTVGLIVYIFRHIEVMVSFNSLPEYFYNIRYAAIHTDEPLVRIGYWLTQIKTFSMILSLILMYEIFRNRLSKNYRYYLFCFIALTLVANVIQGARNEAVYLLLAYSALYIYINGLQSVLKVSFVFVSVLLLLSIYTRGVQSDDLLGTFYQFMYHIAQYAFGGVISFGAFLKSDSIQLSSSIVTKVINAINSILNVFGSEPIETHELKQAEFADIGKDMRSNIYTFLAVRISYFGIIGAGISIVMHAVIITIVYKLKNTNIYFFILYILMIPTTILTLFHEYFFSMTPYYLRGVLLVFVLYTFNSLKKKQSVDESDAITKFKFNKIPGTQVGN